MIFFVAWPVVWISAFPQVAWMERHGRYGVGLGFLGLGFRKRGQGQPLIRVGCEDPDGGCR